MCRAVLRTGILRPLSVMAAPVSAGVSTNTAMRSQDPADRETLPVVQTLKHTHQSVRGFITISLSCLHLAFLSLNILFWCINLFNYLVYKPMIHTHKIVFF